MGIGNVKPRIRKLWRSIAKRPYIHRRGKGCRKYETRAIYEARGWTRTRLARDTVREREEDRRLGIMPVTREARQYLYPCLPSYGARK